MTDSNIVMLEAERYVSNDTISRERVSEILETIKRLVQEGKSMMIYWPER